ncbi:MAG: hypothetical protein ABI016_15605 [Chthoniobacterales bacterium]
MSKPECGQASFWSAALNSSTEIASASSARHASRTRPRLGLFALAFSLLASFHAAVAVPLSHQNALRIGRKIWQNECGGTVAGLTSWNTGENFASLGIGHFIWYPAGARGPFEESFPEFIRFAQKRGAKLPALLLARKSEVCPWNSRTEFLAATASEPLKELRTFLADTIDLQADFLVNRMRAALSKMQAAAPATERAQIEEQFNRLASSAQGNYALIDYVNFKGEGVLSTERYQGRGWGLLQVLEGMSGNNSGAAASREFADSAAKVLRRRVELSPPERNERRWLPGWLNRVASYRP